MFSKLFISNTWEVQGPPATHDLYVTTQETRTKDGCVTNVWSSSTRNFCYSFFPRCLLRYPHTRDPITFTEGLLHWLINYGSPTHDLLTPLFLPQFIFVYDYTSEAQSHLIPSSFLGFVSIGPNRPRLSLSLSLSLLTIIHFSLFFGLHPNISRMSRPSVEESIPGPEPSSECRDNFQTRNPGFYHRGDTHTRKDNKTKQSLVSPYVSGELHKVLTSEYCVP